MFKPEKMTARDLYYKQLKKRWIMIQSAKGVLFFVGIAALLLVLKTYFSHHLDVVVSYFQGDGIKLYVGLALSELFLGLVPPELFMLTLPKVIGLYLIGNVWLSILSYLMSLVNYFIGTRIGKTGFYRKFVKIKLNKESRQIKRFGGVLIIIAALTPLSYGGIALLMGAMHYNFSKFALYSTFRFLRFVIYGYALWTMAG